MRALLTAALLLLAGCYPHWGPLSVRLSALTDRSVAASDFGSPPVLRLGGLPYGYLGVPMPVADPADLGAHRTLTLGRLPLRLGEESAGLVYTREAGFLDLAHLRNAVDLTRYAHERIREAFRLGRTRVELVSSEPSVYRVALALGDGIGDADPGERAAVQAELAIRLAQRLGYLMTTWHEVLTFYGYRSGWIVPERQSAFVWDDQPSHMLGALVAGEALRSGDPFERAVDAALAERLARLGALPPERTREVARAIEGEWRDGEACGRLVHLGVGAEPLVPWRAMLLEPAAAPVRWQLPSLADVHGYDLRGCCRVVIEPRTRAARALYEALGSEPRPVEPERDFPALQATLRGGCRPSDGAASRPAAPRRPPMPG